MDGVARLQAVRGPFDIVGDVHGCRSELVELLQQLGYGIEEGAKGSRVHAPAGRMLAFVGDLVDRGPDSPGVLELAMSLGRAGQAVFVAGNRDVEVLRALQGQAVASSPGLIRTMAQFAAAGAEFRAAAADFLSSLPWQALLDGGRLVIAHAGLPEGLHGSASGEARQIALQGSPTGERDAAGRPLRVNWAAAYQGKAFVAYGHTPGFAPVWLNNTVNLDTGCVYGGSLTALRYPERETVAVAARATYSNGRRMLPPQAL